MVTVGLVMAMGNAQGISAQLVPSRDSRLAQAMLSVLPADTVVEWYDLDMRDRDALSEAIERIRTKVTG